MCVCVCVCVYMCMQYFPYLEEVFGVVLEDWVQGEVVDVPVLGVSVCACVCVCVRAGVRVCVCMRV